MHHPCDPNSCYTLSMKQREREREITKLIYKKKVCDMKLNQYVYEYISIQVYNYTTKTQVYN